MTWSVGQGQAFVAETSVACGGDDNQMTQRTILVTACAVLPCNAILLCSCAMGMASGQNVHPVANANDFDFDQGCLF
jgi:hypothetical protein